MAIRKSGALDLSEEVGPPIIHCSAGIGRSGTFCLIDTCLVLVRIISLITIWSYSQFYSYIFRTFVICYFEKTMTRCKVLFRRYFTIFIIFRMIHCINTTLASSHHWKKVSQLFIRNFYTNYIKSLCKCWWITFKVCKYIVYGVIFSLFWC